ASLTLAGTSSLDLPRPGRWLPRKTKTPGGKPRRECIRFHSRKKSPSVGGRIELPSCLSQRILDLGEVAIAHYLENQPVDVGFEFIQSQSPGALPASWLPVARSRGLLTRSSQSLASVG